MQYYSNWDIPANYILSTTSTIDTSTFTYSYVDSSIHCFVVSSDEYEKYSSTITCKFITDGEYMRLYNAAYKIKCIIYVVGSRANGTASETSDWDYIIEGLTNRKWKSIRNSIPGAKSIDNPISKIDLMHTPLDESKPFIAITPFRILNIL